MDLFAAVSAVVLSVFDQATDLILSVQVSFRAQESSADEYPCVLVHRTSAIG
jgi:hypothetical protein